MSDEFDNIKFKFSILVYKTLESLKNSDKSPGDLHASINILFPENDEILGNFVATKAFSEIFKQNYWSFFDYELLALIINTCCTELKKDLNEYVTTFNAYCCRRVSEVPTPFTSISGKHYIIRVKLAKEFDSLTMNEVKDLEARLRNIIKKDLRLLKFESGSIVIVFTSLNEDGMLPLSEIQKCELFQLSTSVLKLYSDNHVYFDRDEYTRETNLQLQKIQLAINPLASSLHELSYEDMTHSAILGKVFLHVVF